jgi:hypothetical protein
VALNEILLALFAAVSVFMFLWGFLVRDRIYQFPFLAALVFLGWVFPQLVTLSADVSLPIGVLEQTVLVTTLCAAACYAGYAANTAPLRWMHWDLDERKVLALSLVLSGVGGVFFLLVRSIADDVTREIGGQWSGVITIYAFFARLFVFGFALAFLQLLTRPSWLAVLIVLMDCAFYIERIVLGGRRAEAAEFFLIIVLALWFQRRILVPRWAVLAAAVLGTAFVFLAGEYRGIVTDVDATFAERAERLMSTDIIEVLGREFAKSGEEMRNAVYIIAGVDRLGSYDYGLSLWNWLVFHYVPGQLVGPDVKEALMLPAVNHSYEAFGYVSEVGTTFTGMADSYASFGYLGALKFFLIAFLMSTMYRAAMQGHHVAKVLVLVLTVPAIHTITHGTHWFFKDIPQIALFLIAPLGLARRLTPSRRQHPSSAAV